MLFKFESNNVRQQRDVSIFQNMNSAGTDHTFARNHSPFLILAAAEHIDLDLGQIHFEASSMVALSSLR